MSFGWGGRDGKVSVRVIVSFLVWGAGLGSWIREFSVNKVSGIGVDEGWGSSGVHSA